jgi:hypothetical protein
VLPGGAGLEQGHRKVGKGATLGLPSSPCPSCSPSPFCSAHHNDVVPADNRCSQSLPGLEGLESLGACVSGLVSWRSQEGVEPSHPRPSGPSLSLHACDSLRSKSSELHWPPSAFQGHRNTPPVSSWVGPRFRGAPTTMATLRSKVG